MKRPTTGRRHLRSGSIPVTDLIRKRPVRLDVPAEHRALANALAAAAAATEPDGPASHRRPQHRSAQLARVAGLGVAAGVLCGSIAVASVITHHRVQDTAAPATTRLDITGEQALLPEAYVRSARQPASARPTRSSAPATRSSSAAPPRTGTSRSTTSRDGATSSTPSPPRSPGADSAGQLVREYYHLVGTDPRQAFGLLSVSALNADPIQFVHAWTDVRDVRVIDLVEQADGSVVTVVGMHLPDGRNLRFKQLLRTAGSGTDLRIVGAQLLSAQYS